MIVFVIKSTVGFILIYALYKLLLSSEKMHVFKRFYLLAGIIFSIVFAIIKLKVNIPLHNIATPEVSNKPFIYQWSVLAVYLTVLLVLAFRFGYNILSLIKQQKKNRSIQYFGQKIILVDTETHPYSFFNNIYVNNCDFQNGAITKEIILHEFAHVNQKHSIDIVFIELIKIIFWFNPTVWLYKKEMKLNHEYLADNAVLNAGVERYVFQSLILNVVSRVGTTYLTSNYTYSLTKKRLKMLAQDNSPFRQFIRLVILVPDVVLIGFILSSSQNASASKIINKGTNIVTNFGESEVLDFQLNYTFPSWTGTQWQKQEWQCDHNCSE